MYKMIFFDLDGTLRDEVHGIPSSAIDALNQCRMSGYRLCLCTGRTMGTIPDDVSILEWDGIIAGNGCYVVYEKNILKDVSFCPNYVEDTLHFLQSQPDAAYVFETVENIYMNHEAAQILYHMNETKWSVLPPHQQQKMRETQKIPCKDTIAQFSPREHRTGKLCLWATPSVCAHVWEILSAESPKRCQDTIFENRRYWEIIRAGCDKGDAIRELCELLDIAPHQTLAFGNGANDINMFQQAGASVAMSNGESVLFDYADTICEPPMENGIYLELKRRHLI